MKIKNKIIISITTVTLLVLVTFCLFATSNNKNVNIAPPNKEAFVKDDGDMNYVILRTNDGEKIIDKAPTNWKKNISDTLIFQEPLLSPRKNYVYYEGTGYEWTNTKIYNIATDSTKAFGSMNFIQFTPDEKFVVICSGDRFGNDLGANIYKLPNYEVVYSPYKTETDDYYDNECSLDPTKQTVTIKLVNNFSDDGPPTNKEIIYSLLTGKISTTEVKP